MATKPITPPVDQYGDIDLSQLQDWVSPQQLADWLGVPLHTVFAWNRDGLAPRRARFGKHVRYHRDWVRDWIMQREVVE